LNSYEGHSHYSKNWELSMAKSDGEWYWYWYSLRINEISWSNNWFELCTLGITFKFYNPL